MQRWTWLVVLVVGGCLGNTALAQPQDCLELTLGEAVEDVADAGPYLIHSTQYCIRVPAGGLALRIEVQSLGEGDLDLFARLSERVDGNDVIGSSDHIQISEAHDETMTIDQASFPPLVEGTYFIAVGNVAASPMPFRLSAVLSYAQLRCAVSVQGQIQGKVITLKHAGERTVVAISPSDDEYEIAYKIWERALGLRGLDANLVGSSLVFGDADVSFDAPLGVAIFCGAPGAPLLTDLEVPAHLPGDLTFDVLFTDLEADVVLMHITLEFESGGQVAFSLPVDAEASVLGVASVSAKRADLPGLRGKRGKVTVIVQLEDAKGQLSNALSARTRLL